MSDFNDDQRPWDWTPLWSSPRPVASKPVLPATVISTAVLPDTQPWDWTPMDASSQPLDVVTDVHRPWDWTPDASLTTDTGTDAAVALATVLVESDDTGTDAAVALATVLADSANCNKRVSRCFTGMAAQHCDSTAPIDP